MRWMIGWAEGESTESHPDRIVPRGGHMLTKRYVSNPYTMRSSSVRFPQFVFCTWHWMVLSRNAAEACHTWR
eukprot:11627-Eustigmatos_ZCMA.PRE.1